MPILTDAVQRAVEVPPESIRIILNEIPLANWWHAGTSVQLPVANPLEPLTTT